MDAVGGSGDELLVTLSTTQRATNLSLTEDGLHVVSIDTTVRSWKSVLLCQAPEPAHKHYSYPNVLYALLSRVGDSLVVDIRILELAGRHRGVVHINAVVDADLADQAERWVEKLMTYAYTGCKPGRRLRVLINPFAGPGKARAEWTKLVEPIFRSANCVLDTTFTERQNHGRELAEKLDVSAYDGLVIFSGDGLVHEAINGFCSRPDAIRALKACPIGVLPGGSGNALSCSVSGPKFGNDLLHAALTIIKGHAMSFDICSITQGEKRYFSFLSQAYGIMADVDLGTEHMRWMGGQRFVVGFIQRALAGPHYECDISMRIVESDKHAMKAAVLARPHSGSKGLVPSVSGSSDMTRAPSATEGAIASNKTDISAVASEAVPPLRFGTIADPLPVSPDSTPILNSKATGWTTVSAPLCTMYAGTVTYLADSLCQFPIASNDGLIVMSILPIVGTMTLLNAVDGAESAKHYDHPQMEYYKVEAYRITPKPSKGKFPHFISIDGEHAPYEPFQVEPHPGIGSVLSLQDHWYLPPQWTQ